VVAEVITQESALAWEVAARIDQLASEPLPWTRRLEEIGSLLLRRIGGDAIWLLTLTPLKIGASAVLRARIKAEADAVVSITDALPPISDQWPPENSILRTVLNTGRSQFPRQSNGQKQTIDQDLADTILAIFDITVQAIVPIRMNNRAAGILLVGKQTSQSFLSQETQALLEYLGQHLGLALYNAQLLETARRQAEQLATLNRLARTINSSLDLDDIIQRTMAGINEILDVEAGSLLLLDEQSDELYFKVTLRGENKSVTSFRLRRDQGIAGWVVEHQRPALVNDVEHDARFYPNIDLETGFKTKSVLCTPLIVQGRPIGALEVINKRSGHFTEDDQELLTSMTASLAIALHNATLFDEVQVKVQRTEIINKITAIINSSTDPIQTSRFIIEQLKRLFSFDRVVLALKDETQQDAQGYFLDEIGLHEAETSAATLIGPDLQQVTQHGRGAITKDLRQTADFPGKQTLLAEGVCATMTVPLMSRGQISGTLTLASRTVDLYQPVDLALLEQLSPSLTIALEKAQFIALIEQRTNELKLLNRLGEMVAGTIDPGRILETTLNTMPRLISADVHGLVIAEEAGVRLGLAVPFAARGRMIDDTRDEMLETFQQTREHESPLEILETRLVAGNLPVADDWQPRAKQTLPIITRAGSLGVVYVAAGRPSRLGDSELRLLSLVVSQLSTALENAYLFRQVQQEQARLSAFLTSTADAILVVDKHDRIVLDNPAALAILEAKTSQAGRLLSDVTDNEPLLGLFEMAKGTGRAAGQIPSGDNKTFYAVISPAKSGQTEVSGWVAALQDVTHFKELDQLKSEFVNAVSHDLRSPLSGIDIACHLIHQAGDLNDRQRDFVNTIQSRVEAMTGLIDELLDVSKIEAGIDMTLQGCRLDEVVLAVVDNYRGQAVEKEISLVIEVAEDLPPVRANVIRLRQALSNLIGNALKYSPQKGWIAVRLRQQSPELILFQVEDNGPGIPKIDQPRIFDKFYRVRGEHMVGHKGSGLGLAIARTIIEKHNGKIWVESEFGRGSIFSFSLPVDTSLS
jgi:signal transduction histidine kinase/transcriptional regulator with GAF, ATPase, and Fis domain